MIKAEDIRKINPEEYRYLTMDENKCVYCWVKKPYISSSGNWWTSDDGDYFYLGNIEVEEFHGKDWKECLIEFEPDYSDMIGCVGWFSGYEECGERLGVLVEIKDKEILKFVNQQELCFKRFRPAKPYELKFYKDK